MSNDSAERDFYDRQLRVLGKKAMERMQVSKVLIVGLGGLGVEIAKNIILTGVHSVYLLDDEKVKWSDLSANFFVTEHDIGSDRVDAVLGQLKELNSYVNVDRVRGPVTEDLLHQVNVAVWTEEPVVSLVDENEMCRRTDTRFIACETRGVFASLFCDMGEEFRVFDENGEPLVDNMILDITQDNPALVTVLDDKVNHGLGIGDRVVFENVGGMTELNDVGEIEIEIGEGTDAHSFYVKIDTRDMPPYEHGTGYCSQRRPEKTLTFQPLSRAVSQSGVLDFLDFDMAKDGWGRKYLHPMFVAMNNFICTHGRSPRPYNEADANEFLSLCLSLVRPSEPETEGETDTPLPSTPFFPTENLYAKLLAYTYQGVINPLAALIGGFAAQEIQKAVSGKFSPLHQWFYFDAIDVLDLDHLPLETDATPIESRFDGQIMVFGKEFQDLLKRQSLFLVGSGALGCEYLKNFAMIGVASDETSGSRVVVTDMDNVEVSNLNRQFLFRGHHVGKMKSVSAADAVRTMNSLFRVEALVDRVGPDTEQVFDDPFWDSLDCVVNALDNINARLYVDEKCVYYARPLIEAGTLGPKANTQVVLPHITQSYGAERDPPEKTYPQCTLKNFPHKIEHTISWARDLFEKYFVNSPKNVNQYLTNPNFVQDLRRSVTLPALKAILADVRSDLTIDRPASFEDCVAWARLRFEEYYHDAIAQLLFNFPSNHVTDNGLPFWSGEKRCPSVLYFDPSNEVHLSYIVSAANLRATVYGLRSPGEGYDYLAALERVQIPEFVPRSDIQIKVKDDDGEEGEDRMDVDGYGGGGGMMADDEADIQDILSSLPAPATFAGLQLREVVFEKDDDSNFHVDFMTACSNARALNYNIPIVDRHKTKGIAGRIIPAMVTSTALITGFGCLELYKVLRRKTQIEAYRNAYVNLALPLCSQSEPVPPAKMKYLDVEYTQWDMFRVNLGRDVTLGEFLMYFKQQYNLTISTVNYGQVLVYASFLPNPGVEQRVLSEICFELSRTEALPTQKYLVFIVLCETDSGEDVDVPDVRYQFRFFG